MNPGAMKTNEMKNRAVEGLFIRPAADALTPVESEDLSRFEGEGGPEAPTPNWLTFRSTTLFGGDRAGGYSKRTKGK
jgi:hypothetical protein